MCSSERLFQIKCNITSLSLVAFISSSLAASFQSPSPCPALVPRPSSPPPSSFFSALLKWALLPEHCPSQCSGAAAVFLAPCLRHRRPSRPAEALPHPGEPCLPVPRPESPSELVPDRLGLLTVPWPIRQVLSRRLRGLGTVTAAAGTGPPLGQRRRRRAQAASSEAT